LSGFITPETDDRSEESVVSTEEMPVVVSTLLETNIEIAKIESNKAAEILKFGGTKLNKMVYKIIRQMWSKED
jgi:hypothetical protein